jgi:hypothetical protein
MVLKNPDLPATSGCRHLKGVVFGDRLSTQARRRPTVARRAEDSPAGDIAAA